MKQYKLLVLLCLWTAQALGQEPYSDFMRIDYCHVNASKGIEMLEPKTLGISSVNGAIHTPKGPLKALIICAGFGAPWDNMSAHDWATGSNTFPGNIQPSGPDLMYNNITSFSNPSNVAKTSNISNFYYQMSRQTFQFYADVYPTRINVNPSGVTSWSAMNRKVIQELMTQNPTFNWGVYDQRTNNPNYTSDNSTSNPDNKPDYLIIVYRYNRGWTSQPVAGMNNWTGSGGGYASADGLSGLNYGGYTFDGAGFTAPGGADYGLFIHEFAHTLFHCPHFAGANSVTGAYFELNNGWGSMNLGAGPFNSVLGWERWYLGWSELLCNGVNSDIQTAASLPSNGEFILRDFITTGDMIRITLDLPGTAGNQYLWLENHKGTSVFDNRLWVNDGCGNPFAPSPRGLMAYITDVPYQRNNPSSSLVSRGNSIYYLHGKGNFDYSYITDPQTPCHYWNNPLDYVFSEDDRNPMGRRRRNTFVKADYNNNGTIAYSSGWNSGGGEHQMITRRNNQYTFDNMMSEAAFPAGSKIGIATNPPLVNVSTYNPSTQIQSPIYLNGISVSIIEYLSNGDVRVKIQFNDVQIDNTVRWTGDIMLPNIIAGSATDLIVNPNVNLTMNLNRNAHRATINSATNGFTNPSSFELMAGSKMSLSNFSKFIIDEGSTLTLRANSILEVNDGAQLWIKKGTLIMEAGAAIIVNGTGMADISCQSTICANSTSSIQLTSANSTFTLHNGSIIQNTCLTNLASIKSGSGILNDFSATTGGTLTINNTTYNTDKTEAAYKILADNNNQVNAYVRVLYNGSKEVSIPNNFTTIQGSVFEIRTNFKSCP